MIGYSAAVRQGMSVSPPRVVREVYDTLQSYDFPGNVRQLSHVIECATLLVRIGVIAASDLPRDIVRRQPPIDTAPSPSLEDDWPTLAALQRRYIERVLARTGGNKTHAAEILGMDRRSILRMFERERAGRHERVMRPLARNSQARAHSSPRSSSLHSSSSTLPDGPTSSK